jgi:8-oxo-dGTP pyrophosphatase MutT (NUDIX family)
VGEAKKRKKTIKLQAKRSLSSRESTSFTREFSAGGVVYKRVKESFGKAQDKLESRRVRVKWLVTKSAPSKLYPKSVWRLPKGWLDDKDNGREPGPLASGKKRATETQIKEAAIREVREEGGVEAQIVAKIGTERYFFQLQGERILKFATFYLMEWIDDLREGPGSETEEVLWLSYAKARKRLSYQGEKKILDKADSILDRGVQQKLV